MLCSLSHSQMDQNNLEMTRTLIRVGGLTTGEAGEEAMILGEQETVEGSIRMWTNVNQNTWKTEW